MENALLELKGKLKILYARASSVGTGIIFILSPKARPFAVAGTV